MAKVNSIIIPGINDDHVPEVARVVSGLGADVMNCISMIPVEGAVFGELKEPDPKTVSRVRFKSESIFDKCYTAHAAVVMQLVCWARTIRRPTRSSSRVCVPTPQTKRKPTLCGRGNNGRDAGQPASRRSQSVHIFSEAEDGTFTHRGIRLSPPVGGGNNRWSALARSLRGLPGGAGQCCRTHATFVFGETRHPGDRNGRAY